MTDETQRTGPALLTSARQVVNARRGALLPVVVAVVSTTALAALHPLVHRRLGIRWAFDGHDLGVYFSSARWSVGGGTLYDDVPSEYPLLANLLFAAARWLGDLYSSTIRPFYGVWILMAAAAYLYGLYRVAQQGATLAVLVWLSPAAVYFSLLRYDVFPALATLLALLAIRRGAEVRGALWLGVAVALKGYALFLLPAYGIYLLQRRGFLAAVRIGSLTVLPMAVSLLVVLLFAGWDGVTAPFTFHADRGLNGQSTYDAINYVLGTDLRFDSTLAQRAAQGLQVGAALAAAALRPRTFDQLVSAFLVAMVGFITFSVFYSPQFVVWILPIACLAASRRVLVLAIAFSWLSYLYFPAAYDLTLYGRVDALRGSSLLDLAVLAVAITRVGMIVAALADRWPGRSATGLPVA